MKVRQARAEDRGAILAIYAAARRYMKRSGNPTQWGDHAPEEALIDSDLARGCNYVVVDGQDRPHGVFALIAGEDPTYRVIEGGGWLDDAPYSTLHRVASDGSAHGVFAACLDFCTARCGNLRIDTHPDNRTMRHLIEKHGFVRCGIIHVADGSPRIAYQRRARDGSV